MRQGRRGEARTARPASRLVPPRSLCRCNIPSLLFAGNKSDAGPEIRGMHRGGAGWAQGVAAGKRAGCKCCLAPRRVKRLQSVAKRLRLQRSAMALPALHCAHCLARRYSGPKDSCGQK